MKNLVIGNAGQIGSAIQRILECDGYDNVNANEMPSEHYDALHITIPYSENFIEIVKKYLNIYEPDICIIHSTVPIGTTEQIPNAVYSPCRGVHPELEKGIRTFVKYFAGDKSDVAAGIFKEKGMTCTIARYPKATRSLEAAKLWDTTQYGWNIVLEKAIHTYCVENNLDFKLVYTLFNESYNYGYEKLGFPQYKKYILEHRIGKIGGHCVIPNLELLKSPITQIIKDLNID